MSTDAVYQAQVQVQFWEDTCRLPLQARRFPGSLTHSSACMSKLALCQALRACPASQNGSESTSQSKWFHIPPDSGICVCCCCRRQSHSSLPLALERRSHSWLRRRPQAQLESTRRPDLTDPGSRELPAQPCLELPAMWPGSCLFIFSITHIFQENILIVKSQTLTKRREEKPK